MSYNDLIRTYNYLFDAYDDTAVMVNSMNRPKMGIIRIEFDVRKDAQDIGTVLLTPFKEVTFSKITFKKYHGRKEFVVKASDEFDYDALTQYMLNVRKGTIMIEVL